MFSALKKWAKGNNDDMKGSMPSGVRAMGQALQRKFARGIQFNMKIVIRGDRNTGKSCLFQRLQGKTFNEQYIPTNEIQVASIHWNYRTTDDVVKVEVWDVVDKGRSRKTLRDNLKLENEKSESEKDGNVLDAEFVDVFKGAHGVMMILDITKPWTFQYIQRELPKVPPHLPVLVLASHRDMGEHRLVQADEVIAFIEHLERPDRSPPVHYAEASMKNSFGLKYIHKFLNLPFLLLQRETLLKQLQVNSEDMESTLEELQIHKESEDQDYDKFVSLLERKKKEHEAKKAAAAAAATAEAAEATIERQPTVTPALPSSHEPSTDNTDIPRGSARLRSATDIDEFVPDDELDAGFLDDEGTGPKKRPSKPAAARKPPVTVQLQQQESDESESDSDTRNPMVAGFAEDLDSEDESSGTRPATNHVHKVENNGNQKNNPVRRPVLTMVEITSSEEEPDKEEQRTEIGKDKTARKGKQSGTATLSLEMPVKSPVSDIAADDVGLEFADVNDWLNTPDADPKTPFSTSSENKNYTVRKGEVGSSSKSTPIDMDEWDRFMALQMQPQTKAAATPASALIDMDTNEDNEDEANEEGKRSKKQEHKSGEKSRSKHKHRRHKDKCTEGEEGEKRNKERRRSRHKEGEKDKGRRKSKDEELEKKKKSNPRHSRSKNEEGFNENVTYEEL